MYYQKYLKNYQNIFFDLEMAKKILKHREYNKKSALDKANNYKVRID